MPDSLQGEDWRSVARTKQPRAIYHKAGLVSGAAGALRNRPFEIPFKGWRVFFGA